MANTNSPRIGLAWEINRLKNRKRRLRTQSTAQFSQLAALETDKFILEDENMRLKELDYEMQVKIELKDSVNEELRKQIQILKKLTGQTDSETETTSSARVGTTTCREPQKDLQCAEGIISRVIFSKE